MSDHSTACLLESVNHGMVRICRVLSLHVVRLPEPWYAFKVHTMPWFINRGSSVAVVVGCGTPLLGHQPRAATKGCCRCGRDAVEGML